jgi:lysozyme
MTGDTLAALLADLRRDEGLRLTPYVDTVGKLTIGYGHNLTDLGITKAFAEQLLADAVRLHLMELEALLPWVKALDPVRQRVMGNLAYNLGLPRLLKFRKFLASAKAGQHETAALHLLDSKWAEQVGERADRLAEMWRTGRA